MPASSSGMNVTMMSRRVRSPVLPSGESDGQDHRPSCLSSSIAPSSPDEFRRRPPLLLRCGGTSLTAISGTHHTVSTVITTAEDLVGRFSAMRRQHCLRRVSVRGGWMDISARSPTSSNGFLIDQRRASGSGDGIIRDFCVDRWWRGMLKYDRHRMSRVV
jgi:hypothetical protein